MPHSPACLEAVLHAADALLEARNNQMVSAVEWDGLRQAVDACHARAERLDEFTVEDGYLVRRVETGSGSAYQHRCPEGAFLAVAESLQDLPREGVTLEELHSRVGIPWTQVGVAFAFLKARGVLDPAGNKKHAVASGDGYLDAMIEYHPLREGEQD